MLSLADVRSWNPGLVDEVAVEMGRRLQVLLACTEDCTGILPVEGWTGPAADAALARQRRITSRWDMLADNARAVRTVYMQAADAIPVLHRTLTDLDELGRRYGYQLTDTWTVTDLLAGQSLPADLHPEDRARAHQQLTDGATTALATATEIDTTLATVCRTNTPALTGTSPSGATQPSLHDQLLTKYQVKPDPDGMVDVPFIKDDITASEFEHLLDLGFLGAKDAYDIYQHSLDSAKEPFNEVGGTNGHTDAVRHILWNAALANRFGQKWTEGYTTAHERKPPELGVHASEQAMDLHNNELGRRIAAENPDAGPDELLRLAEQAVRNGDAVVINLDGRLTKSNEVAAGETLDKATDPPPTAAPNPGTKYENAPGGYDYGGGYNPGGDAEDYGTYEAR